MKHEWRKLDFRQVNIIACDKCGTVKRNDGQNKPCKGLVKVELRVIDVDIDGNIIENSADAAIRKAAKAHNKITQDNNGE